MNKDNKHTPLPWQIGFGSAGHIMIETINEVTTIVPDVNSKANAEFIVRACNEFYQLKARIAELEAKYETV